MNDNKQVDKNGKQFLRMFEDIISEKHTFRIANFSNLFERYGPGKELVEKCHLCGTDWIFTFKPYDDYTEYASAHVSNLSENSVAASYVISIVNSDSDCNVDFTDPEGMVLFDKDGGGDDTWGTDEFILTSLLDDSSGFVNNDIIEIVIEIRIRGIVKSSASTLSKALEDETGMRVSLFTIIH